MISKFLSLGFVILMLAACKKNAGMHCPVMESNGQRTSRHAVDLSPVQGIKPIMDTLAAHPELQATMVSYQDHGYYYGYSASATCKFYYKNIQVLDEGYNISVSYRPSEPDVTRRYIVFANPIAPLKVDSSMSVIPAISSEKAREIAFRAANFTSCPVAELGLFKVSQTGIETYRLIWQVRPVENTLPLVILDAHTGNVYTVFDEALGI